MSKPTWFLVCSKSMFPSCASFGPLAIAFGSMGQKNPSIITAIFAAIGAVMTASALLFLYKSQLDLESKILELPPRDSSETP